MIARAARWADLVDLLRGDRLRDRSLRWMALVCAAAVAAFAPVTFVVGVVAIAAAVLIGRHPAALAALLIICMGNTKANLYLGFITVFPEYLVLIIAVATGVLAWMERPRALDEPWFLMIFAALTVVGLLSATEAREPGRALTRAMIVPIAGLTFWFTTVNVRDVRVLERGMSILQWAVSLHAVLAVWQLVAAYVLRVPFGFEWLSRYGNPAFEYNIGPPVLHGMTSTFRANGLFNDPNILGGFLGATLPLLLALALRARSAGQLAVGWGSLALTFTALLLTLSRSGFLAAVAGIGVFLACRPTLLRDGRLVAFSVSALAIGVSLAAAVGVRALLLVARLASSFASHDYSARQHEAAFWFAWRCVLEHPLTGIGLNNFGIRYSLAVEPSSPAMMSHNAFLTWFAETGLLGGSLFVLLIAGIFLCLHRASKAIEESGDADSVVAWLVPAFTGCLAAIVVSNLLYDFSLRSFVWVLCGLALATARLSPRRGVRS